MRVGGTEPAGDRPAKMDGGHARRFQRGAARTESGVSARSTHFPLWYMFAASELCWRSHIVVMGIYILKEMMSGRQRMLLATI